LIGNFPKGKHFITQKQTF